ncbi:MAG: DUF3298 domain-containing protein [Clostridiales bacterium]|nr:DUF3298 domain-containing protein [Clostridiales bacterium]
MEKWKKEYEDIKVPTEMRDKIEEAVARAQQNKKKVRKVRMWKSMGTVAAVLAIILVLPNTSQTAAAAMQKLPILGDFFKVVTIREYQVDEDHYTADVKVPEVVPGDAAPEAEGAPAVPEETVEQAKQTAEEINFDIQEVTEQLINEFKSGMETSGEGYQNLTIDSKVLADTDRWFSLELSLFQASASGYEQRRHYTIDKTTGKKATLADFYGEDYVEVISEEIRTQMREQMAADENLIYWIDDTDMPENNFQAIAEDQDFYVNEDGKVVIGFDEYEVAPGYMGYVEFTLK